VKESGQLLAAVWDHLRQGSWQFRPQEEFRSRRGTLLEETLAAARAIPFYARHFREGSDGGSFAGFPLLERGHIPPLNRSVRETFPPDRCRQAASSSGSTGQSVEFLFDTPHQRSRFACRLRYLRANGWHPLRRTAWIIHQVRRDSPDHRLMRGRLHLGSSFLSVFEPTERQYQWLRRLDPHALYTYPTNLDTLLDLMARRGPPPSLRLLLAGAEVVDDALREKARRILGLEIAANYGTTETFVAWQCPRGSYHVNTDHLLVEILDDRGHPAPAGTVGRVVLTTLHNRLMPLVRYEIGDWAAWAADPCRCGRTLPVLEQLSGRSVNLLRHRDGSLVSPWRLVVDLKHRACLTQFQVIQRDRDTCVLRYVAPEEVPRGERAELEQLVAATLGAGVRLVLERRTSIPRSRAGKYFTVWSELERPLPEG
jgi:phenylacetate-CoA ligase